MTRPEENFDAIVIGAGVAGATLALDLGKAGFAVALLESQPINALLERASDGRTTALGLGNVQYYDRLGIGEVIRDQSGTIDEIRIADQDSPAYLHYHHELVSEDPMGFVLENGVFRKALMDEIAKEKTIEIFDNVQWKSIKQDSHFAQVALKDGRALTAKIIIAADGKKSAVRDYVKIPYRVKSYKQTAIVGIIEHEKNHENVALERFLNAGPFAVLPMRGGHHSSIVWSEAEDLVPLYLAMPEADFNAALSERMEHYLGKVTWVGKRWAYPLSLTVAEKFNEGRVVVIGDAAHAIHPIAGQGLNLSLRDVQELVRHMRAQSKVGLDIGASDMLAKFARTRTTDNAGMIAATHYLNGLFSNNIPAVRRARRFGLGLVEKLPRLKRRFVKHAMGV